MPIVYVKDRSNKVIHIEESFSSLVWTERYQENGEFELDLPLKFADKDSYQRGNYVVMDDSDFTMIIETLETTDNDSVLKVSGRTLSSILDRRVNASKIISLRSGPVKYSGDYGTVVSKIVEDDITNSYEEYYVYEHYDEELGWVEGYDSSYDGQNRISVRTRSTPERNIPNFSYTNTVSGVEIDKSSNEVTSIYDLIVRFSKTYVTGFRIDLGADGSFIFKTYKGKDRTGIEKDVRPVIFGPSMDNVIYVNSFEDDTDYKNYALVIQDKDNDAEDIDSDPAYGFYPSSTDKTFTGIDRREFVISGENPDNSEDSEEEITMEESRKTSAEEAFDSGDYDRIKTTEGSVDPFVQYQFGVDYFLGDTVKIESWTGEYSTSLIDEVVRSYDSSGYTVTPNFKSMDDYDYGEEDS